MLPCVWKRSFINLYLLQNKENGNSQHVMFHHNIYFSNKANNSMGKFIKGKSIMHQLFHCP